jgi:hypothetical protein
LQHFLDRIGHFPKISLFAGSALAGLGTARQRQYVDLGITERHARAACRRQDGRAEGNLQNARGRWGNSSIFFRLISRPIVNSMKIRPSSEMMQIDFPGFDPAHAEWTNEKPGDKVGQDQRLPGKMGQQTRHSGERDA